MTYQVLARKWRPKDFSSLVGQDHVVTALRNGLEEGRIAQAYLFSGIRGVGKTTAARVLAKALNCERGPTGDPCGECSSCLAVVEGSNLDVLEIDAATYSKVEQVRELTESLRYGPSGRYKVVVLDEIHRLSRQAFDALLKIVEEPPAHLVFVFATTEKDAVPATLLSRCQEHSFRRVPSPTLAAHLRTIADAESIEVADASLRLIARAGEGSVRDSVSLLDQMATFGGGTIDDSAAAALLGGLDAAIFHRLLDAMVSGDSRTVSAQVAEVEANGWDPQSVYGQFLGYLRDALHASMATSPDAAVEAIDLPREEAEALATTARRIGHEPILQLLQLLLRSEPSVRRSEHGSLALEIAWLRAAELPKLVRIQDLLAGAPASLAAASSAPPPSPSGGGPAKAPAARSTEPNSAGPAPRANARPRSRRAAADPAPASDDEPSPEAPTEAPARASARATPNAPDPAPEAARLETAAPETAAPVETIAPIPPPGFDADRVPALLEILSTRRGSLAAHFRDASIQVDEVGLVVQPGPGNRLLAKALDRPRNAEAFADAVRQVFGTALPFRLIAPEPSPSSRGPADRAEPTERGGRGRDAPRGDLSGGSPSGHRPRSERPREGVVGSREVGSREVGSRDPRAIDDTFEDVRQQPVTAAVLATFGGTIRRVVDPSAEDDPVDASDTDATSSKDST